MKRMSVTRPFSLGCEKRKREKEKERGRRKKGVADSKSQSFFLTLLIGGRGREAHERGRRRKNGRSGCSSHLMVVGPLSKKKKGEGKKKKKKYLRKKREAERHPEAKLWPRKQERDAKS